MTTLLEIKQKIKNFYGAYEAYLQPALKFLLALVYFLWINQTLGFVAKLKNPFVVVILSLLCAILPSNAIIVLGFALIVGHCYGIGIEVAGFALLLILLLLILVLRFSPDANLTVAFTPLAFTLKIPALVPVASGLLRKPSAAAPAGCGVVLYYFMKFVKEQATVLQSADTEIPKKLKLLLDGLMKNQEMWVTVLAFVVAALLVYLLRTRSFDYAWRVAIAVGGITYIFIILAGALFLNVNTSMVSLIISTLVAVLLGMVLEFFAFGGDYTRTEHLEYEDDEYFYYVKAVPKVSIATSKRHIKKINAEPLHEDEKREIEQQASPEYANPIFEGDKDWVKPDIDDEDDVIQEIGMEHADVKEVDFEKKLEESLKDL